MNRRFKMFCFIMAAILSAVFFCSCRGSDEVPAERLDKLRELGGVLVEDLNREILKGREDPEYIVNLGYVLSTDGKSDGIDALANFFVEYEGGNDCEITMVFAEKSFVVTRVVFINGEGYYLRYEYDAFKPDSIDVSGQAIDKAKLKYQDIPPKWDMSISFKGRQVADFVFKNPV